MTEVCAGVSGTVDANNEIGSVGIPFVKTIISVFDPETGEELKYNEQGEVCISGPNVMLGYYENDAATSAINRVHKDGTVWVHSGDIGYINENGSLFIVDRVKKMIVRYDGFKVFPSLIEKTVSTHSAVASCCAVGLPDKDHAQGKLPVVFAVLNEGSDSNSVNDELRKLCQNELPEYAQPVWFKFVDALPLTPIGKVDYRVLEREAENSNGV